ncbi:unnamed protein product [Staurois parvus]|uniref:Uncharacterized protein n=1 Tax=Staurois parvus TaxID=386267 RepID=A0ABN9G6I6_9NEOB|nr:unnamed protein product [Staurois parvus]
MYIDGQTEAVQEWVAIYKRPLHSLNVHAPWEHTAEHRSLYGTSV